jgi:hypothetical protein
MKTILLNIISSDISYNKSATRYLYKTNPALWDQIVEKTNFLPYDSMPKQRVWHILNDVWEIPKCPIEGVDLRWNEKAYLETSSRNARIRRQHLRGDFKNSFTDEVNEKRRQGNLLAVKNGRNYRSKETYTVEQKEKSKQTCLEKYGVENGSQSILGRRKNSDAQIKNGATPKHLRSLRQLYYDQVVYFTRVSWKEEFDKINPTRLNRSEVDLDHIYSIQQGFRDNIPPYIIGHWTNLRMLGKIENYSKGKRCDKTQDQLFNDFFCDRLIQLLTS